MRSFFLIVAVALLAALLYSPSFNAQSNNPPGHDRISSEQARNMREQFKRGGKRELHEFTKFNRQELIDALQSMPETDSVKFIIGAFVEEEADNRKGKPVIMLQLLQGGREVPGGQPFAYSYLKGSICPPPHGIDCQLE